jgi:hypothetical protein
MTTDVPSKNFRPGSRSEAAAPEIRLWKACAWCGPIYLAALGVFWAGVAGFVPPPGEDWSPQKIAAFFTDNEIRVRIGMVGVVVFALCYAVWAAAVARVMRRADGREHLLSTIQFVGGVGNAWVTMAVGALWLTASFRPSTRPSDQILLLNDLAWMVFVMPAMTLVLQIAAVGVWILRDHLSAPLMPRWVGYLSFWMAAMLLPGFLMPTFQTGPFAWHGLLTFYVGLGALFTWIAVISGYTLRAIRRIEQDERVDA